MGGNYLRRDALKEDLKMKKNSLRQFLLAGVFILLISSAVSAATSETLNLSAYVPDAVSGLTITVNKIRASDNAIVETGSNPALNLADFTVDAVNNILTSPYYYSVDVQVNDNTSSNWSFIHQVSSIQRDAQNNLDENISVTFLTQLQTFPGGNTLIKRSFKSSNVNLSKSMLPGGQLRIIYGVATGDANNDAPNTTPVSISKASGTYTGSVLLTLVTY